MSISMHLTRPKSSKGRRRPTMNDPGCGGDTDRDQGQQPESPACDRQDRSLRSRSQPVMSRDEVLHLLQHAPAAPPQSLNKYKVLPSIERRRSEGSPGAAGDHLSGDAVTHAHGRGSPKAPDPATTTTQQARLLLAIRAPCGRRFEQHFDLTDTLQAVRASAEARYGSRYGRASIETMDVPRRTFTDLDLTLSQCGIVNRSVLCLSLNKDSELQTD
ncbi:UBX domain-containing protein 10 [Parambassis ranga]|uniref:UBX domain-containing protein 10 n=1 Tax=Parambassis ranga TaxID=210632 RepID=A0A6P7IWD0_9TELE|nr:UBX domain-containing protein 10 [Parambassis ranga]